MLQNARVTAFTFSELLRENQQGEGGDYLPPRLGLINHYGKEKASTYKSITINQVGDIDGVAAIEEWPGF